MPVMNQSYDLILFKAAGYADSGKGGEPRGGNDFPRQKKDSQHF